MRLAIRLVATTLLWPCIPISLRSAEPTIEELIVALRGEDPAASAEAAAALSNRVADSASAIKALVQSLSDERASQSPPPILIPAPVHRVADSAVDALVNVGQSAVPELAAALENTSNTKVRHRAILVIGRLKSHAPDAVPAIERALSDKEDHIRIEAAEALGTIQPDGQRLVQALVPLLSDKSPDVRAAAVRSLGRSRTERAASQLIPLLNDKGDRWFAYTPDMVGTVPVRLDVVQSLGKIGANAKAALPQLTDMMNKDDEFAVRIWAASAVCRLADDPEAGLKMLIKALQSERRSHLVEVTHATREAGVRAKPALPALVSVLKSSGTLARIGAIDAIVAIDPQNSGDDFLPLTRDSDSMVREAAIEGLGALGIAHERAMSAYLSALDDKDDIFSDNVRHAAAVTLGRVAPKSPSAIAKLKEVAQQDESSWVREAASKSIEQIQKQNR